MQGRFNFDLTGRSGKRKELILMPFQARTACLLKYPERQSIAEEKRFAAGWRLQGSINVDHMMEVTGMSTEVKAPMPGKILEVLVKVGDSVKEDDELIMLEAMKMENPIYAPASGTVKEIKVKANDSVDTEQVMIIIE
jgi:acetyl-CoA carboxylase biotin carboxyl carrier protein